MQRKNMTKKVKKTVALGLATALVVGCVGQRFIASADTATTDENAAASEADSSTGRAEEYSSERIGTNYTIMSSKYTLKDYAGEKVSYEMGKVAQGDARSKLTTDTKEYEKSNKVLNLVTGDKADVEIDVPEDGLYYLNLDYYSYDESILPISLEMKVDGSYPFYETRNLKMETTWKLSDEPVKDRYDKEVVAIPVTDIRIH